MRSVLLYNCGTWALTKTDEEKLDSFHRKQLRRVLGIRYPAKISNKSLYKKCEQTPISLEALQARWRLFGHVLRREQSIPANKAMAFYFHDNAKRARGRPISTLPMALNNDLKILLNRSISLTSQKTGNIKKDCRKKTRMDYLHRRHKEGCQSCEVGRHS